MSKSSKKQLKVADFETTSIENFKRDNSVRVWAVNVRDITSNNVDLRANNIEAFFNYILNTSVSLDMYFHNLKFDGSFIVDWLLRNGWRHLKIGQKPKGNTFQTLITDTGVWFSITIYIKIYNKRQLKVTIFDSLKKLPFSADKIAKAFNLPIGKGKIDYDKYRPIGYEPTEAEWEYIDIDTEIIARALKIQFDEGLDKMTVASDAMGWFKDTMGGGRDFKQHFPTLEPVCDDDIRKTYRGGWTYLKEGYSEKMLGATTSFDVNSLYPHAMKNFPLPFGEPYKFKGQYKHDPLYPLYTQTIDVMFTLKKNMLPTIQIKGSYIFSPTEYLKSSDGKVIELNLTSVDLELFFKHYDVHFINYVGGYAFQAQKGFFEDYINYWYNIKQTTKDPSMRTLAKLMLNSLYGKFGQNPKRIRKQPSYYKGKIVYETVEDEDGLPVYTPMASFITAWARKETIEGAQANYNRFIYADTDSIHLIGTEEAKGIVIDENIIGAWKHEGNAKRAKFVRAKTYMKEYENNEIEVKCAGMPQDVKKSVTFNNFKKGAIFGGKLQAKKVVGGTLLNKVDFTIKNN